MALVEARLLSNPKIYRQWDPLDSPGPAYPTDQSRPTSDNITDYL